MAARERLHEEVGEIGELCSKQPDVPLESEPIGGYLLASVWSPELADEPPRLLGTDAFAVRLLPMFGISFVTPDSGPVGGGTLLVVVGSGFMQQSDLSCAFNNSIYTPAKYVNDTTIYCTTPPFHAPGPTRLRVASRYHELSLTSLNFVYTPRWEVRIGEESICFAGEDGDNVVLYSKPAAFAQWAAYVYRTLCLFTVPGPPMRYLETDAYLYAWNETMRIVCPCPVLTPNNAGPDSCGLAPETATELQSGSINSQKTQGHSALV